MSDDGVTIIRCRACRNSGTLSLQEQRFWCALCQDWATVDAENVRDVRVERGESDARLVPRPPKEVRLQPLRIPPGWLVDWNTLFEEEPTDPVNAEGYYAGGTDLFAASHVRSGILIDVEWSTEPGNPNHGRYLMRAFRRVESPEGWRVDWGNGLKAFTTVSRVEVVRELEEWFEASFD